MKLALKSLLKIQHKKATPFSVFEELDQNQAIAIAGGFDKTSYTQIVKQDQHRSIIGEIIAAVGLIGWVSCYLLPRYHPGLRKEFLVNCERNINKETAFCYPSEDFFTISASHLTFYREKQIKDLKQLIRQTDLLKGPAYVIDHIASDPTHNLIHESIPAAERKKLIEWCKAYQNRQRLKISLFTSKLATLLGGVITAACFGMRQRQEAFKKTNGANDPNPMDKSVWKQHKILGIASSSIALIGIGAALFAHRWSYRQSRKSNQINTALKLRTYNIFCFRNGESQEKSYKRHKRSLKLHMKLLKYKNQPPSFIAANTVAYGISEGYIRVDISNEDKEIFQKWCENQATNRREKEKTRLWMLCGWSTGLVAGSVGLRCFLYRYKNKAKRYK